MNWIDEEQLQGAYSKCTGLSECLGSQFIQKPRRTYCRYRIPTFKRRNQMNTWIDHSITPDTLQCKILKSACERKKKKKLPEKKLHLKDHWISSIVFPFVSGTQMVTNTTVKAHTTAYMVKVPDKNKGSFWLTKK